MKILSVYNIDPGKYLRIAKRKAQEAGYDPALLKFSDKPRYKLEYDGVSFGHSSYPDFIIYSILAEMGDYEKYTKSYAAKRRASYLARASKIEGDWRRNRNSPNWLAIRILW